jgi:hypothetical protein
MAIDLYDLNAGNGLVVSTTKKSGSIPDIISEVDPQTPNSLTRKSWVESVINAPAEGVTLVYSEADFGDINIATGRRVVMPGKYLVMASFTMIDGLEFSGSGAFIIEGANSQLTLTWGGAIADAPVLMGAPHPLSIIDINFSGPVGSTSAAIEITSASAFLYIKTVSINNFLYGVITNSARCTTDRCSFGSTLTHNIWATVASEFFLQMTQTVLRSPIATEAAIKIDGAGVSTIYLDNLLVTNDVGKFIEIDTLSSLDTKCNISSTNFSNTSYAQIFLGPIDQNDARVTLSNNFNIDNSQAVVVALDPSSVPTEQTIVTAGTPVIVTDRMFGNNSLSSRFNVPTSPESVIDREEYVEGHRKWVGEENSEKRKKYAWSKRDYRAIKDVKNHHARYKYLEPLTSKMAIQAGSQIIYVGKTKKFNVIVSAILHKSTTGTAFLSAGIFINGSAINGSFVPLDENNDFSYSHSTIIELNTGDVIELGVRNDTTSGNMNIDVSNAQIHIFASTMY